MQCYLYDLGYLAAEGDEERSICMERRYDTLIELLK